ncbi:MAG: hypothetical protein AB7R89_23715 [Dehalococcoidia bacterium]
MTTTHNSKPHPANDVPGIVYDPVARRARVAGAGLEVWEIINGYRSVGYDWERLERSFGQLSRSQLKAAVTFANRNPRFIAAEIAENDAAEDRFFGRTPRPTDLPAVYEIPSR